MLDEYSGANSENVAQIRGIVAEIYSFFYILFYWHSLYVLLFKCCRLLFDNPDNRVDGSCRCEKYCPCAGNFTAVLRSWCPDQRPISRCLRFFLVITQVAYGVCGLFIFSY